jgi:AmmeMemoRadiSam system protein B
VLPKPFATPLGRLPLDLEVVGVLERQLGAPTDHDLLVHRTEHSLELTATYLAYALDGQVRPIVPVLCGVGAAELRDGGDTVRAAITEFVESLQTTLGRLGRRACFVAGADLAHVGPRFGDSQPVTDAQLEEVEAADRRALAAAADGDAERFAAAVLEVDERHRVCGLGAIYTVLRLLETGGGAGCGELVDYGQARDADGSQCVSFAGMCFARG